MEKIAFRKHRISENKKQYYFQIKDKLREKYNEKRDIDYTCECGCTIKAVSKRSHINSLKHKKNMDQKNETYINCFCGVKYHKDHQDDHRETPHHMIYVYTKVTDNEDPELLERMGISGFEEFLHKFAKRIWIV